MAINPEKGFASLRSLKYLEEAFLGYWHEAAGPPIELFWQEIENNNLPFVRKDLFKDVAGRKKIKNMQEYETIIDGMVMAQQTGKICAEEAAALNKYLEIFENKRRGKE